jgi:galactose mutarotase-like enzyme
MTAIRHDPAAIVLAGDDARLTVDAGHGARFASLVVDGHELLVTEGDGPIWWGSYPMAPFAGRIRDGRFPFQDRIVEVPLSMPPNAIHGTVFDRAWEVTSRAPDGVELMTDLGPDWPFRGRVVQAVAMVPGGLEATLLVLADEPMPVVLGFHPWFRRTVDGAAAELSFEARAMYRRGPDGLPTGAIGAPTPRPWDDAFADLVAPPRLTWPGVLALDLRSDAPIWVVYDERDDAICVEPQTAPPDAFNLAWAIGVDAPAAAPGRPVSISMAWRWSPAPSRPAVRRPAARRPAAARVTPSKRRSSGRGR